MPSAHCLYLVSNKKQNVKTDTKNGGISDSMSLSLRRNRHWSYLSLLHLIVFYMLLKLFHDLYEEEKKLTSMDWFTCKKKC